MCCKGFFKRILPFFLTFAAGLFIASFFVSIAAPTFQFNRAGRRHQEYHRQMEFENQRLREENLRLNKQLIEKDTTDFSASDLRLRLDVPPPPPIPSVPHRSK